MEDVGNLTYTCKIVFHDGVTAYIVAANAICKGGDSWIGPDAMDLMKICDQMAFDRYPNIMELRDELICMEVNVEDADLHPNDAMYLQIKYSHLIEKLQT